MASLSALTADTIAEAITRSTTDQQGSIYVSGGGAHNPFIINRLRSLLPHWSIRAMADLGISGDAKEAMLFAMLANECVAGKDDPSIQLGGIPLISMGKISLP
jgi:anhydro-N-acetylmuramic acid kinase